MNQMALPTLAATEPSTTRSLFGGERIEVPCTIDIAHTPEEFHAHVQLQGIEVGPGDEVLVHDAPIDIDWGEHIVCDRRATVTRATWLGKLWTRLSARFELTMLYEVSFSPDRLGQVPPRRKP